MTGKCPMAEVDTISVRILNYIRKRLKKKYGEKKPLRTFHAKTIGLVEGVLTRYEKLPCDKCIGVFQHPGPYKVWIRFTNGSSNIGSDTANTARGMAIKIMDVQGSAFLDPDTEGNTQDIILFTSPMFAPGVSKFQLAGVKLVLGNWREVISAAATILFRSLKGSIRFVLMANIRTPNILEEVYYSGTPYAFGTDKTIKWQALPLKTVTTVMPKNPGPDFLREALIEDLSEGSTHDVGFDLLVQFQENEKTEPVDDSRVIWKTPFEKVATITIPRQLLNTEERKRKDLQLSYSPGHSLTAHAPRGSVNMVRRKIYAVLAKERLEHPGNGS